MFKQPKKRWSKLQKEIEKLFVPELKMKIYCNAYPIGEHGNTIPRFYISINRNICWDFPKYYDTKPESFHGWASEMDFSQVIRNYIDCPVEKILGMKTEIGKFTYGSPFMEQAENDLIQILIAADRRLGKEKLLSWFKENPNGYAQIVMKQRYI